MNHQNSFICHISTWNILDVPRTYRPETTGNNGTRWRPQLWEAKNVSAMSLVTEMFLKLKKMGTVGLLFAITLIRRIRTIKNGHESGSKENMTLACGDKVIKAASKGIVSTQKPKNGLICQYNSRAFVFCFVETKSSIISKRNTLLS